MNKIATMRAKVHRLQWIKGALPIDLDPCPSCQRVTSVTDIVDPRYLEIASSDPGVFGISLVISGICPCGHLWTAYSTWIYRNDGTPLDVYQIKDYAVRHGLTYIEGNTL